MKDSLNVFKYALLLLLQLFLSTCFANPSKIIAPQSLWLPHTPFYITTGYSLTHELYRNRSVTQSEITPPFTYDIHHTYPNNMSGWRFGFGSRMGAEESNYGYELDFNQVFATTKNTPGLKITRPEKILTGFITYTLNPEARLKWIVAGAGVITTVYTTTRTIPPNEVSYSNSVTTTVDPGVAGVVLYHLNNYFAVKGVFIYKIAAYNSVINGTLIPLLMVNYYPSIHNR